MPRPGPAIAAATSGFSRWKKANGRQAKLATPSIAARQAREQPRALHHRAEGQRAGDQPYGAQHARHAAAMPQLVERGLAGLDIRTAEQRLPRRHHRRLRPGADPASGFGRRFRLEDRRECHAHEDTDGAAR